MTENTHNGFEYVDLGLPSGLLWATCNVGAKKPEENGLFFQWGDTIGYKGKEAKTHSNWNTTPFNNGNTSFDKKSMLINKNRILKDNCSLRKAFDAAHIHMGGNWRMPTKEEFAELMQHTTSEFIINYKDDSIKGRLFTSKTNNNTIFIPASGHFNSGEHYDIGSSICLWSSSVDSSYHSRVWYLYFSSSDLNAYDTMYRFLGFPVRGVF